MIFDRVSNYIRMKELAGHDRITAKDVTTVSESAMELTEDEMESIPYEFKKVIDEKVHVLDFADNKLVLKPISMKDAEDKTEPKLNTTADYEKDGGDATEVNKKMGDNSAIHEKEFPTYSEKDVKKAKEILDKKKSKLDVKQRTKKDADKESEDAEYAELMKRKNRDKKASEMSGNLSLAKENAEDAGMYTGTEFSQDDYDEYHGLPEIRDIKMAVPASIKKAINKRIKEIEQSIKDYDDKGYSDGAGANSNKNKAIDALEQIRDNLASNDWEGFREAQQFFLTLMSPITDLLPASLINYLSNGADGPHVNDELTSEVEPHETDVKETGKAPKKGNRVSVASLIRKARGKNK